MSDITSGVYYIKNTKLNKYYIGSSSNVNTRLKTHKQHLEKGCHNCRILQKDYDIYGLKSFEFKVIEYIEDQDMLTAYEKYYIYKYDAIVMYKGYNEKMPTLNHKLFKKVYNEKHSVIKEDIKTEKEINKPKLIKANFLKIANVKGE